MKRIRIDQDTEIEIVKKGDEASKPLGFISWSNETAEENGINVVWGNRGEVGSFIPEAILKRVLKEFEHDKKSIEKNSSDSDDYPIYESKHSSR